MENPLYDNHKGKISSPLVPCLSDSLDQWQWTNDTPLRPELESNLWCLCVS